jgi:hypothetical protein
MTRADKKMKFTTSFELNDLPIELLSIVFTYTGGLFLLTTAQQVCKQWHQGVNTTSEELWKTLFKQQFPETAIVMEQLVHDEEENVEQMNHRNEFVKKAEQLFERRREIFDSARDSVGTEFVKELLSDKWMKDARFAFGHQLKLIGTEMSEDKIPIGYSKTGGTPDLPLNYELKLSSQDVMFLFQINLDHASFFIEPGVLLPKRGMLYVYVVTSESDRADVFYLSPSEIKQFGGLIRKDQSNQQHKERDDGGAQPLEEEEDEEEENEEPAEEKKSTKSKGKEVAKAPISVDDESDEELQGSLAERLMRKTKKKNDDDDGDGDDEDGDEIDKVTSGILQFSYNFSFSDGIKHDEFPEFTSEQVDFIRTVAQKIKEKIRSGERHKLVSFSLFGSNEPECEDRLEITDEYITEANFNGMKIVSLDQLLPKNEQSAVVSKLLEQYNADHPEDQYEVAFKETHETNAWFQNTEPGLVINERNFDIKYLFNTVDKNEHRDNYGQRFQLSTSSNDQISKRDGLRYSRVSNHILFMKQSLYDQCKQREPVATEKRNETRLLKAKLEQERDEESKRKQEEADRQEEEKKQRAKLEGTRYIRPNLRRVYYHPTLYKRSIVMPPCTVFSDLLYCKDPAWKSKMSCFIQWFSGESICQNSGMQSWELFMRQGQYLKDNGDYNFDCIQDYYHND